MAYIKKGGHGGLRPGQCAPPEWVPTDIDKAIINCMAEHGIPQLLIELKIGKCWETIKKHLPDLIVKEQTNLDGAVVHSLWLNAVVYNNVSAQIWWTKSRLGWKEAKDDNSESLEKNMEVLSELAKVMKAGREGKKGKPK